MSKHSRVLTAKELQEKHFEALRKFSQKKFVVEVKVKKTELVLKDVLFDKSGDNTLMIKFIFSVPRTLRGADFVILNTIALSEIKKRITSPFAEPNMAAWADHRCKTLEKTIMISLKEGYGTDIGHVSYQEATSNYNEAIKACIASGLADKILHSPKAQSLLEPVISNSKEEGKCNE